MKEGCITLYCAALEHTLCRGQAEYPICGVGLQWQPICKLKFDSLQVKPKKLMGRDVPGFQYDGLIRTKSSAYMIEVKTRAVPNDVERHASRLQKAR